MMTLYLSPTLYIHMYGLSFYSLEINAYCQFFRNPICSCTGKVQKRFNELLIPPISSSSERQNKISRFCFPTNKKLNPHGKQESLSIHTVKGFDDVVCENLNFFRIRRLNALFPLDEWANK